VSKVGNDLQNIRVFFLYKAGQEVLDSRRPEGLAGKLEVRIDRREGDAFVGTVQVSNVGTTAWLPSGNELGCVRVGVQLKDQVSGRLLARDYARIGISEAHIEPGETTTASFAVPVPDVANFSLVFDLVSEYVVWFSQLRASTPVTLDSSELPG
jgi:hypothetical protein